jgi:hypothetical protein
MSKYDPLKIFLKSLNKTTIVLSFQEIERILKDSLPPSASNHGAWWSNDITHHVHARAWLEAGWLVESPIEAIRTHKVTFSKIINETGYEKTYEREKSYKDNEQANKQRITSGIDYYGVLGLSRNATAEEIKNAYRELAQLLHPDKHGGSKAAEERFKQIQTAYEILSDSAKKSEYDEMTGYSNGDKPQDFWSYQETQESTHKKERQTSAQKEGGPEYSNSQEYDDYIIDNEISRNLNTHQSNKNTTSPVKIIIGIFIAVFIIPIIMRSCQQQTEPSSKPVPNRPRIEYTLPKTEGTSITVKSNILTEYFGISNEQRQRSNLFTKDSYEYRYNGNGTWTITKKGAVINTPNNNYIDTNNKEEVENYLHGLGF